MIIVRLMGGLGNQMFQYAAARNLAIKGKTELKIDISAVLDRSPRKNFTFRDYELDVFKLDAEIATDAEIREYLPEKLNFSFRVFQRLGLTKVIKEVGQNVNSRFFLFPSEAYLWGYWQNQIYFNDIAPQIFEDFTLKEELIHSILAETKERLINDNSVAVHIRRGDYVSNSVINQRHGSCTIEYYQQAISRMQGKVKDPVFYVFSDDLEWARKSLSINAPSVFIEDREHKRSFEDLYLMSLCKHNIIANSSYSWWGAWLNQSHDKIVIAPQTWFNNKQENRKRLDSLPNEWIII